MATDCTKVLYLPPRLAGITPCRITQNRSSVIPPSRTRITMVTHQGSRSSTDSATSAVPVSALSAMGSAILPTSVTRPRRRARSPSSRSVIEATVNTTNAVTRQPVLWPSSWNSAQAKTGTSSSRSRVSPFATFATRAVCGGVAAGSGTTALTDPPARPRSYPGRRHRAGHRVGGVPVAGGEVDPGAAGHLGPDQVADPYARGHVADQGGPVDLGRLVGGAALDTVGGDGLDEHLDGLAEALLRALRHQLVDQLRHPGHPAVDHVLAQLAVVAGGLGAVLVGVAEHPDGVQPGLGEEPGQLGDVGLRLAREAHDDVRPDACGRGQLADLRDELQEPVGAAEAPHPAQHRLRGVLEGQVEVRRDTGRGRQRVR